MYPVVFINKAEKDIPKLRKEDIKHTYKVWELIFDIFKHPSTGIGKPEPLKYDNSGWWSRRISQKHRLIYRIENDTLQIVSCFGHYGDK